MSDLCVCMPTLLEPDEPISCHKQLRYYVWLHPGPRKSSSIAIPVQDSLVTDSLYESNAPHTDKNEHSLRKVT